MNTDNRLVKQREQLRKRIALSAERELSSIEETENIPKSLNYFIDLMRSVFVKNKLPAEICERKKIGIYCMMVPEELIYAAGAVPVKLSAGCYESSTIGEEMIPRDSCLVAKSSLGLTAGEILIPYEECETVIVPTTCDSIRKLGEEISKYKNVWTLEVPHVKETDFTRRIWVEQIKVLRKKLEELTGQKITKKKVLSSIRMIAEAQKEAARLLEIRKSSKPVISGREAALAVNSYSFCAPQEWTKAMSKLNDELEERLDKNVTIFDTESPRILLAGSPSIFPNWKVYNLIEEMGGITVIDESCTGDRLLYDPVGMSEKSDNEIISALAARYMMPCVCPTFSPNEDRLHRLKTIIEDYRIDGVLYHVLKGCIVYDYELPRVNNLLKKYNIPVLRLETEYNPEDIEQMRTRIEAYIEMLRPK